MLNTSIEDDTSFRIEYKNQKSLSWRFERKMLYFTAMSIHYKIRRNNNTDLNISRIQLQILSIHGKDINTFPMCMHCRRIRAWFHEEKQLERKEEKFVFMMILNFEGKRGIWWKPQNVEKWIFYAQIISIEYFIVAWVET